MREKKILLMFFYVDVLIIDLSDYAVMSLCRLCEQGIQTFERKKGFRLKNVTNAKYN